MVHFEQCDITGALFYHQWNHLNKLELLLFTDILIRSTWSHPFQILKNMVHIKVILLSLHDTLPAAPPSPPGIIHILFSKEARQVIHAMSKCNNFMNKWISALRGSGWVREGFWRQSKTGVIDPTPWAVQLISLWLQLAGKTAILSLLYI